MNNGSMGNEKIDPQAAHLYKVIGTWLKANEESIYNTRANPLPTQPSWGDVSASKDGKTLYLHVLDYPDVGNLTVHGIEALVTSTNFLETGEITESHQKNETLTIQLPLTPVNQYNTVIKVSL